MYIPKFLKWVYHVESRSHNFQNNGEYSIIEIPNLFNVFLERKLIPVLVPNLILLSISLVDVG